MAATLLVWIGGGWWVLGTAVQWASAALARTPRPEGAVRHRPPDFSVVAPLRGAADASPDYVGALRDLAGQGAEILVVDEALAVGDAAFQRKCLDWIDSFRKTGTLLFVSHSMAEVRRLCTRAIWIEDGCIREQGDPSEVIRNYHRALLMEKDDVQRFSAAR